MYSKSSSITTSEELRKRTRSSTRNCLDQSVTTIRLEAGSAIGTTSTSSAAYVSRSTASNAFSLAKGYQAEDYDENDNGICVDWTDLGVTIADFELSNELKSKRAAIDALDELQKCIENRTTALVVKVPTAYTACLGAHVRKYWCNGYCETSTHHLFFKLPQNGQKASIVMNLYTQLHAWKGQMGCINWNMFTWMNGQLKSPDVSFYSETPTKQQMMDPMRYKLGPPNCWFEYSTTSHQTAMQLYVR